MSADNSFVKFVTNSQELLTRLGFLVVWVVAMLWLSLTPSPPQVPGALGWDKLQHALAYGLLTILVARFLVYFSRADKKVWWQAVLIAVLYGGLLEVLQLMARTGRTAEWWDLAADVVGALISGLIFRAIQTRLKCQEKSQRNSHF